MKRFIRFWMYLKPFTRSILLLFCIISLSTLINLPIPLLEKAIIDEAIPRADIRYLSWLVILIVGLYALYHSFGYLRNYISIQFRQKVLTKVRIDMYEHLQRMSMHYFSRQQSGALLARILNDVRFIQNLVNDEFFVVISSIIKVIVIIFLLFKISTPLTLLCTAVLPFIILIFFIYKQRIYRDNKKLQETHAHLSGKIQENLMLMKLIQAETLEDHKGQETSACTRDLERVSIKLGMTGIKGNFLLSMLSNVPLYALIWGVGGYMVIHKTLTLGSLLAFMQYLFNVVGPVTTFFRFGMDLQAGYAALDRIFEIFDEAPEIKDTPGAKNLKEPIECLRFHHITLTFPDRDNPKKTITALKNLNLEITKGEKIGIVGPSGGGKTSLINLLLRFYNPSEGTVLLNNKPLETFTIRSIREKIAYVPQEIFLFNDTVRNNITLGRDFGEQEIKDALRLAHIDDFVSTMEQGLDSVIGERGVTLSGGQRQRLALARIFLKKPDLFIFDEAFSSLDSKSDLLIQQTLKDILKRSTAIIIAHRFSFLELVNRILVISEGNLIEAGHFEELIEKQGLFYKLYQAQKLDTGMNNHRDNVSKPTADTPPEWS